MKVYLNRTSNAPLRVRIAIALKQIQVQEVHIDLERNGGEQHQREFQQLNPQSMLPVLVAGDHVIRQSLAIIEFLEEEKPQPPLLPADRAGRTRVRSLALMVACDGQPLLNLRVRQYLQSKFQLTQSQRTEWFTHWMRLSLAEYEASVQDGKSGKFSHGDSPTLADVCLVPHVLMARRFKVEVNDFPEVMRIFRAMMTLREVRSALDEHLA